MKRKFLIVLLALTLAIVSAFTLAACDELSFPIGGAGGSDSDNGSTVVTPGGDTDNNGGTTVVTPGGDNDDGSTVTTPGDDNDDNTETHAHNYNIVWGENGIKPTETETGVASMTCVICGDSKSIIVPKLTDVNAWNLEESVDSDCVHHGKRIYRSTAYGKVTVELPLVGHDFGDFIQTVKPTGSTEGALEHYTCLVCEKNFAADKKTEMLSIAIPKLELFVDLSSKTIKKGEPIIVHVLSNYAEYSGYTVTTDRDDIIDIENDILKITQDIYEDTTARVIVTAVDDPNLSVISTITVKANAEWIVTVSAKIIDPETGNQTSVMNYGKNAELVVEVTNNKNDDLGFTVAIENPSWDNDLIAYDKDSGVLTVTDSVQTTVEVTITVVSTANSAIYDSIAITVKSTPVVGEVGSLTSAMLREIANPNITVSGTFTDVYGTTKTTYDYTIKMNSSEDEGGNVTAGAWSATWNKKGSQNVLSDNYKLGENDALIQAYIDKNNKIANITVKDTNGIVLKWSEQHYWNHLDYFANNYKKFVCDDEVGAYRYNAEYGRYELDTNTWTNVYIPSEDEYHLKYIAWSMTPAIEERFYDFYVYLNADETAIEKIVANTYPNPIYATDSDGNVSETITGYDYTTATMYFTEIGTTVVEDPKPYTIDVTQDYYKKLTSAIEKAKNMTNYSFATVETSTYVPDPGDYIVMDDTVGESGSTSGYDVYDGTIKPYHYISTGGTDGYLGVVTPDAILINRTIEYYNKSSADDYVYRTDPYGYKQNSDGTYDEFEYSFDNRVLKGTRKRTGNIAALLPDFDISPAIFELTHTSAGNGTENEFIYTFKLRDSGISNSVARSLCLEDYARFATGDVENPFTITVDENSNITNVRFAYDIHGYYGGTYETVFANIGTSALPEGTFDNYEARVIPQKWSDYAGVQTCVPDDTTKFKYVYLNGAAALEVQFGENAANVPAPTVFGKIFDDNLNGPWCDVKRVSTDADGNEKLIYTMLLTAVSDNVDENRRITDLEEKIDALTLALTQLGFERDYGNDYGVAHSANYVVAFASEELGLQIKVENINTGNFWITIYNYGDYKISR